MTRKNTHTHTDTLKKGQSLIGEGTDGMANKSEEFFFPWRRILGKGPKLSIIISSVICLIQHWVSSCGFLMTNVQGEEWESGKKTAGWWTKINQRQIGHKSIFYILPYGSCTQLSSGRTKDHSNDMRFSASSELSAGVSMANVNKLSQSSMASGQTIRSL